MLSGLNFILLVVAAAVPYIKQNKDDNNKDPCLLVWIYIYVYTPENHKDVSRNHMGIRV